MAVATADRGHDDARNMVSEFDIILYTTFAGVDSDVKAISGKTKKK